MRLRRTVVSSDLPVREPSPALGKKMINPPPAKRSRLDLPQDQMVNFHPSPYMAQPYWHPEQKMVDHFYPMTATMASPPSTNTTMSTERLSPESMNSSAVVHPNLMYMAPPHQQMIMTSPDGYQIMSSPEGSMMMASPEGSMPRMMSSPEGSIPGMMTSQQGFTTSPENYLHGDAKREARGIAIDPSEREDDEEFDDIFCKTNCRLGLSGNSGSFTVSVEEIKRRTGAPECLNSSHLTALIRRSKTTKSSFEMRKQMADKGIPLAVGRRKGGVVTAFTGLSEQEARSVARDLEQVMKACYPSEEIMNRFITKMSEAGKSPEQVAVELQSTMRIFTVIREILHMGESPATGIQPRPFPEQNLDAGMSQFSLNTHSFGMTNQRTWGFQFQHIIGGVLNKLGFETAPYPPANF